MNTQIRELSTNEIDIVSGGDGAVTAGHLVAAAIVAVVETVSAGIEAGRAIVKAVGA
jgi:hypothetical protein